MKGGHAKICEENMQSRWNKQLGRPETGPVCLLQRKQIKD